MAKGDVFWTGLTEYRNSLIREGKRLPEYIERETKDLAFTAERKMSVIIGQVTGEGATGATRASINFEIHKSARAFSISVGPTVKYGGWLDDGTKGRTKGIPIRDKTGNPTAFLLWVRRISGLPLRPQTSTKKRKPRPSSKPDNKNKGKRAKNLKKMKYADDLAFVLSRSIAAKGTKGKNFIKFTLKAILAEQRRAGIKIINRVEKRLTTKR
ncbi:hypothetical protein KAR91_87320 [Candidatus Pacearchaeota archaeon]|nr:hypothetical protein [Candidatus Pacearchaeota archaeon]